MKIKIKLILLLLIAIILYFILPRSSDKLIFIPECSSKYAKEAIELQNTPISSFDYLLLSMFDPKSGWVRVDSNTNLFKIYNTILKPNREKSRKMIMFGGENIEDFTKKIAKQANLDSAKLLKKYKSIAYYENGDIIAKKYNIPYKTTEESTIAYMVYKGHSIYRELLDNSGIKLPSSEFKKYLIIASIIEKETQNYKEMPLISAVIHNRLKKNMRLQFDATLNYGKRAHSVITPQIIKSDNSKFNTYKHKGLPPKPLCSPSVSAFKAALKPAKVDYLYFVKSGSKHTFSKKYKEHTKKVKYYKKELAKARAIKRKVYSVVDRGFKIEFVPIYPKFNFSLPIK
jgi:UPF0755 protein